MPDLLIIDGGLGQVRRALAVLADLQIDSVKTLGIAKGVERISGEERFLGETEIVIDGRSEAGHLLQHIRDEAHRFAITGHRAQRGKTQAKRAGANCRGWPQTATSVVNAFWQPSRRARCKR